MNTRLSSVLSTRDLPLAELSSSRLDGELFAVGEFWCPIDEIDGPPTRAIAASMLVPARAIAERMSAAWIFGLVPEPLRHQFCVDVGARAHLPPSPRLQVREVSCAPEETHTIAGLRVTTPLRTTVDLARWAADDSPDLVALLVALLRFGGFSDATPASRLCQRQNVPNKKIALQRLGDAQIIFESAGDRSPAALTLSANQLL